MADIQLGLGEHDRQEKKSEQGIRGILEIREMEGASFAHGRKWKLATPETLERLVLTRSKLYSSLEKKDLISRFACAINEYFSKQVAPVFLDQITITKAQLDLIVHKVFELLDIYRLLESTYYEQSPQLRQSIARQQQAVEAEAAEDGGSVEEGS